MIHQLGHAWRTYHIHAAPTRIHTAMQEPDPTTLERVEWAA
jgi:hypothetical protein